jgi:hypothetical protein
MKTILNYGLTTRYRNVLVLLNPVQQFFFFSLCDSSTKPIAISPVTFDNSHLAL